MWELGDNYTFFNSWDTKNQPGILHDRQQLQTAVVHMCPNRAGKDSGERLWKSTEDGSGESQITGGDGAEREEEVQNQIPLTCLKMHVISLSHTSKSPGCVCLNTKYFSWWWEWAWDVYECISASSSPADQWKWNYSVLPSHPLPYLVATVTGWYWQSWLSWCLFLLISQYDWIYFYSGDVWMPGKVTIVMRGWACCLTGMKKDEGKKVFWPHHFLHT